MKVAVILPLVAPPFLARSQGAGGSKAFAKIESREVFLRTVELYARRDQVVQRIVVVVPDDLQVIQERYASHLAFQGVQVTTGTSEWFGCVARGVEKLDPAADTVIVHDSCCPAVPFPLSDALEEALEKNKGAAGVVPVVPSRSGFADLEGSVGGAINEYVEMAGVFEVQSPQVFRRKALEDAYAKRAGKVFVDDAELVMAAGGRIVTVAGSRLNQRIDSDELVRLGKDLIDHLPKPKMKTPLNPFGEAEW
jgi:2-C-methyl-D-erythritol 4-phosphate cytidylyltransferase